MKQKVVYICSPYRAETAQQFIKQLKYTKEVSHEVVMCGCSVITPHLYYTLFLNDADEVERELGMKSALGLVGACDAVLVNMKYGVSLGMEAEIFEADRLGIEVLYAKDITEVKQILKKEES